LQAACFKATARLTWWPLAIRQRRGRPWVPRGGPRPCLAFRLSPSRHPSRSRPPSDTPQFNPGSVWNAKHCPAAARRFPDVPCRQEAWCRTMPLGPEPSPVISFWSGPCGVNTAGRAYLLRPRVSDCSNTSGSAWSAERARCRNRRAVKNPSGVPLAIAPQRPLSAQPRPARATALRGFCSRPRCGAPSTNSRRPVASPAYSFKPFRPDQKLIHVPDKKKKTIRSQLECAGQLPRLAGSRAHGHVRTFLHLHQVAGAEIDARRRGGRSAICPPRSSRSGLE